MTIRSGGECGCLCGAPLLIAYTSKDPEPASDAVFWLLRLI
jgi:hypothetical protein